MFSVKISSSSCGQMSHRASGGMVDVNTYVLWGQRAVSSVAVEQAGSWVKTRGAASVRLTLHFHYTLLLMSCSSFSLVQLQTLDQKMKPFILVFQHIFIHNFILWKDSWWVYHCKTLILFFFSHSVVDLLLYLGSFRAFTRTIYNKNYIQKHKYTRSY